jgi:hypothetical protein
VLLDQGDGRRGRASVRVDDRVRLVDRLRWRTTNRAPVCTRPLPVAFLSIGRHDDVPDAGPGILIDNDGSDEQRPAMRALSGGRMRCLRRN